ncbi:HupE/UreJ family protein [Deinococcus ruber]|uniref:Membrane protein n=1 Tax=Deinococcus ruber TaxID=1848197 RepID=A0A918KW80_9DEIO|nr:HupE/UreJ family protein [Deinococcus ruber]GGR36542.1 membrane protein [Deinococcus ruber]
MRAQVPLAIRHRRFPILVMMALLLALLSGRSFAHPMPTTTVQLDLHSAYVTAEFALPLNELQLATGWKLVNNPQALHQYAASLHTYLAHHLALTAQNGAAWTVQLGQPTLSQMQQTSAGAYQEFMVAARLTPPAGEGTRDFTLKYDAIVREVKTHSVLVSIRRDWERGLNNESGNDSVEVGVIRADPRSGLVPLLPVNQAQGSMWQGFVGIFLLGLHHIASGTDHLLFLLTLLLPAPLLVAAGRWGTFGGTRRTLLNIVKITTAFTAGHSLTLLLGTLKIVNVPDAPIEALIAVSILVSAVHAWRPLFPGRELLIAGGFGLIHGLAFSYTLAELNLSSWQTALSLLGFNLGIEAMQLVVIAVTMPWLILLAQTKLYPAVRMMGAALAFCAALGWLGNRVGWRNPLGALADQLGAAGPWALLGLAMLAVMAFTITWRARTKG